MRVRLLLLVCVVELICPAQISMVLEIPKSRFMMMVREGSMLIFKDDVRVAQYINSSQNFLNPGEIDELNQLVESCQIEFHNMNDNAGTQGIDNVDRQEMDVVIQEMEMPMLGSSPSRRIGDSFYQVVVAEYSGEFPNQGEGWE